MLVSGVALIIFILYLKLKSSPFNTIDIFILLACCIGILIGYVKTLEPAYSIKLDEHDMSYQHRFGTWQLAYNNIRRLGIPRVHRQGEYVALSYVGINIINYQSFLQQLHPRLAVKLLMEQKNLIQTALVSECPDGTCPSELIFDDENYTTSCGHQYSGLIAMFANRMTRLKSLLGYDLYIPTTALDREEMKFIQLITEIRDANRV